jgi:hypothetical protein
LHELQSQIRVLSEKQKLVVHQLHNEIMAKRAESPSYTQEQLPTSPTQTPHSDEDSIPTDLSIKLSVTTPGALPASANTVSLGTDTIATSKPGGSELVVSGTLGHQTSGQVELRDSTMPLGGKDMQVSGQPSIQQLPGIVILKQMLGMQLSGLSTSGLNVLGQNATGLNTTVSTVVDDMPSEQTKVCDALQSNENVPATQVACTKDPLPTSKSIRPMLSGVGGAKKSNDTNIKHAPSSHHHPELTREERKKLEFMTSLGLVTPNSLKEMQNKRTERKRKSTANPQFVYGHFEQENVESREDSCAMCHRSGELLMCDVCSLVYHLQCLDPPLTVVPQGFWSCPKCQSLGKQCGGKDDWPGTLVLVHSYLTHKAVREDEKKRLRKKSEDLAAEKRDLEEKTKLLTQALLKRIQQRNDIVVKKCNADHAAEKLRNFVQLFQQDI